MCALDDPLSPDVSNPEEVPNKRHHRNPRADLGQASPQERARRNERRLLMWIARWGYTCRAVAERLTGRKAGVVLDRLTERGLAQRVAVDVLRAGVVWMLTPDGFAAAKARADDLSEYEFNPAKCVRRDRVRHHLATQHCVCDYPFNAIGPDTPWRSDITPKEKRPDCVVRLKDGSLLLLEIELTEKYQRELDQALLALVLRLEKSPKATAIYISHSKAILANYQRVLMAETGLRVWSRKAQGAGSVWVVTGRYFVPTEVTGRIAWKHVPGLFERVR